MAHVPKQILFVYDAYLITFEMQHVLIFCSIFYATVAFFN